MLGSRSSMSRVLRWCRWWVPVGVVVCVSVRVPLVRLIPSGGWGFGESVFVCLWGFVCTGVCLVTLCGRILFVCGWVWVCCGVVWHVCLSPDVSGAWVFIFCLVAGRPLSVGVGFVCWVAVFVSYVFHTKQTQNNVFHCCVFFVCLCSLSFCLAALCYVLFIMGPVGTPRMGGMCCLFVCLCFFYTLFCYLCHFTVLYVPMSVCTIPTPLFFTMLFYYVMQMCSVSFILCTVLCIALLYSIVIFLHLLTMLYLQCYINMVVIVFINMFVVVCCLLLCGVEHGACVLRLCYFCMCFFVCVFLFIIYPWFYCAPCALL